ncbi:MAG: hypothetical protein K0S11_1741 [Gammaproteobacteria bacterium]|jgi:putative lipoic acid-binding regulatory protein|nr:hypothetical protein [Gammaproteobacteria bacterium]
MIEERETLLEFPCDFPIKVFGLANAEFESVAYTIVRKHVSELAENAIAMRYSKDSKYLALTIVVKVSSQAQLDAIYSELSAHKAILMAL